MKRTIAFTPDAARFAVIANFSDGSGRVVVWDATTGKPVQRFEQSATSIALTPDGSYAEFARCSR